MKAIHNFEELAIKTDETVFNISKIQNESNSQQGVKGLQIGGNCVQYFKDTK